MMEKRRSIDAGSEAGKFAESGVGRGSGRAGKVVEPECGL